MKRRDLNICQEGARQAAWLSPLCPQRSGSYWEASVLPCQSKQLFCWLMHGQCSAAALSEKKKKAVIVKKDFIYFQFCRILKLEPLD